MGLLVDLSNIHAHCTTDLLTISYMDVLTSTNKNNKHWMRLIGHITLNSTDMQAATTGCHWNWKDRRTKNETLEF